MVAPDGTRRLFAALRKRPNLRAFESAITIHFASARRGSQPQLHEDAVGIFLVVAEGAAVAEAEALVELLRRQKGLGRPRLEAEQSIRALARDADDVGEDSTAGASSTHLLRSAHGLHFAMRRRQLLERPAAEQLAVFPHGPEGDVRSAQLGDVQRVDGFGRGELVHVREVLVQQGQDLRPREVVDLDSHDAGKNSMAKRYPAKDWAGGERRRPCTFAG